MGDPRDLRNLGYLEDQGELGDIRNIGGIKD